MNRNELLALPVTVDLPTAGIPFGFGRAKSYQLAAAGEFPVPVLTIGHRKRVVTADLWRALGVTPDVTDGAEHHLHAVNDPTPARRQDRDQAYSRAG